MNNLLSPNDLGRNILVEDCQKLDVNDFVRRVSTELKKKLIQLEFSAMGVDIELTTSRNPFGGQRIWFKCPACGGRVGSLFKSPHQNVVACRSCLKLEYRTSRYRHMLELQS